MQRATVVEKGYSVNGFRNNCHQQFNDRAIVMGAVKPCRGRGILMETLHSTIFTSFAGPLFLAASGRGLVALEFQARLPGQQTIRPNPRAQRADSMGFRFEESATAMRDCVRELEEYFAGTRREFSFPLDLRGTDFQLACWRALLAIPYGETRSYGDIARAVGR